MSQLTGVLCCWLVVALSWTAALGDDNLGSLIDEVFGPPSTQEPPLVSNEEIRTNEALSTNNADVGGVGGVGTGLGGDQCQCVPYYLCVNNTIITDGTGLLDIRIKGEQCDNYMDICCREPLEPHEAIKPKPHGRLGCGKRNIDGVGFRITGNVNNEAQFGEFPWMVAILRDDVIDDGSKLHIYQCGGSLIHEQVVMTAAHCVIGKDAAVLKVRVGEWDTQTKNELYAHQDRQVAQVIIHDKYYSGALYNDIALLILRDPVEFADNVDIVCLPLQGDVILSNECYASGWGKDVFVDKIQTNNNELAAGGDDGLEVRFLSRRRVLPLHNKPPNITPHRPLARFLQEIHGKVIDKVDTLRTSLDNLLHRPQTGGKKLPALFPFLTTTTTLVNPTLSPMTSLKPGKEGHYQVILKKIDLPMVPRNKCVEELRKTRLGPYFRLHESFVCAGGVAGKDTCKGDGGSPLVCPLPGREYQYQQVGIVAWGIGCGNETPAVYVNVAQFRDWIDLQMKQFNFRFEYNY